MSVRSQEPTIPFQYPVPNDPYDGHKVASISQLHGPKSNSITAIHPPTDDTQLFERVIDRLDRTAKAGMGAGIRFGAAALCMNWNIIPGTYAFAAPLGCGAVACFAVASAFYYQKEAREGTL